MQSMLPTMFVIAADTSCDIIALYPTMFQPAPSVMVLFAGVPYIRLQPENRNMDPIILRQGKDEISILGKVTGLYRRF